MKLYKKLFAMLLCAALLLSLAFGSVSAGAPRISADAPLASPEVPEGYDGFVVVDFEAFVLGWGYVVEPTLVPYRSGETVADVTIRLLETAGVGGDYQNSQYGFYLNGIECEQLASGAEIVVPDYLAPELENNYGCYNDDGDGWYNPENGDGILSQQEYTYYSGWMFVDNNVSASVGADGVTVEDGHVYRWMYSIYGWGMDIGINDGWGMFAPFDNPSFGVDRDAASALLAEIAADPELAAKVDVGGTANEAYNAFMDVVTDLSSDQTAIDEALDALIAALSGGALPGDVDGSGSVTISDALAILRHSMGTELLEGDALESADVNGDGSVLTYDALLAMRIALNLA